MGYYTRFALNVYGKDYCPTMDEKIRKAFTKINHSYFGDMTDSDIPSVQYYFEHMDTVKWYEYEEDMIKISKMFPTLTFCLNGEGEEAGDIWKAYFKNGLSETCQAKIVIPEPNEYFLTDMKESE